MALNTVYKKMDPNTLARLTYRDPGFGIGYALANAFIDNYNDRGVRKSVEAMQKSLEPNSDETAAATSQYLASLTPEEKQADFSGMNKILNEYQNGNYQVTDAIKMPGQQDGTQPTGAAGAAQGYEYAPQFSPEAQKQIQALAMQQSAPRLLNFDPAAWKAEQTQNLLKQGRSQEQIDAAMQVMQPQIQQLTDQANQIKTMQALSQAAGLDWSDPRSLAVVADLQKSNPEIADLLVKQNFIPGTTRYANDAATKRAETAQKYRQENMKYSYDLKNAQQQQDINRKIQALRAAGATDQQIAAAMPGLIGIRGNTSSRNSYGGNGGTGLSNLSISDLDKLAERANNTLLEDENPARREYAQKILAMVDRESLRRLGYTGDSSSGETSKQPNLSDWNVLTEYISDAKKQGANDETILQNIQAGVNAGEIPAEFYGAVKRSFRPAPAANNNGSGWQLFPDWGASQRSGIAAGDFSVLDLASKVR